MKKFICLICFLFTGLIIPAQCEIELKKAVEEKSDTFQIRLYRRVLNCYYKNDAFKEAINIIAKIKSVTDKAVLKYKDSIYYRDYLSDLATLNYYKGDIQNCSKISEQMLQYDYRKSDSNRIAWSLGNLAITYRLMGNYPKAIYCIQEALKINLARKRKDEITSNYSNLSNVYLDIKDLLKGKYYLLAAIKIREEDKDLDGLYSSYGNMGNYFQHNKQFDSAFIFYNKALALIPKIKISKNKTGLIYNNITALYIKENNIDSALYYSEIAKGILSDKSTPRFITIYYLNKGLIEQKLNKHKMAIMSFNSALLYASKSNDLDNLMDLAFSKSKSFDELNQKDSAFQNLIRGHEFKDSLTNTSKTAEITRYEMQYQFDKEQEILKNEQIKKEIETKNTLERKQLLIYAAIIALVLLFGLVLIILKSNHQKRKDNLLLQQKNDLIETQKKDIIDSINYAKNLQQAILPPIAKIKKEIGECFVYYKPKDIIAGDFYWLYKPQVKKGEREILLFAVADCTGHGVPGALVSVVCSNALDSAVKEFGLTDPGKILDKTREIVLETFSKTGQNLKDGMDISLCSIEKPLEIGNKNQTVKWAGANNSLWYIHKQTIQELTANKQPIGFSEHHKPFTTHQLDLEKGDTLYFSTDGYYDQFGGDKSSPTGKKFMRKRLSQLFLSIKDETLEAQLKMVDDTFCSWKGSLEQIDDVCVAGIRL
ncbi:MAG: tetratricopeptide repeat protein [Bacteroidota bacterium]|nr:tetratricopeptide repeat protein [Bacteroidota bacterium]MDP3147147.1 tetratricopeptide repeat protein [Bacteroidota bacterium]